MIKQFLILFAFISVLAFGQVPQRFNKVVVTGDITSPKFIKTGSNADSVLLGNGSARAISTIKTDTVNLSNRINAKATGSGTANGTNTGDETLTSIKTKLGAATSVSDGYLKYQDFADFSGKVSNATHTGDVTGSTALTLATVNSNIGTFNNVTINAKGLATAGSNVSYLIGITSGQVTTALGYTPKPTFTENTGFNKPFGTTTGTVLAGRTFGTAANSAVGDFIQNQNSSAQSANMWIGGTNRSGSQILGTNATSTSYLSRWGNGSNEGFLDLNTGGAIIGSSTGYFQLCSSSGQALQLNVDKSATFSSTVNSTGFLLNGNNLTSSLTANYIPKWNGSSFVNSNAGTDYQLPITLTTNGTSGAATFSGNVLNVPNYTSSGSFIQNQSSSAQSGSLWVSGNIISNDKIEGITISTESVDINTSGAQINFYGTSGSGVLNQPFRGLNYKKVMIYLANFVGNNNINYLTAFTYPPAIVITDGLSSSLITSKSTTSVTITSASSATGILILEGY